LQKYKEFFDKEFVIVGGHEGSGPDAGTVVFEVKTKEGKVFSVRPKGTREERTEWLNDMKNIKGKELTVRYQNLSEDGIPIFPVGIAIRDYE
jgi:DNA ligase-1